MRVTFCKAKNTPAVTAYDVLVDGCKAGRVARIREGRSTKWIIASGGAFTRRFNTRAEAAMSVVWMGAPMSVSLDEVISAVKGK